MKLLKKLAIGICFLFLAAAQAPAQGFLHTKGKAIVNGNEDTVLLRGMGLGGWMVQEGYMLKTASFASPQHKIREKIEQMIGTTDTDLFYENWLANHVRKIDIDSLKAWGFNSVRLPMHYNLYTLPIEDEPAPGQQTWLTKGFELTDSLISWCSQNQMYVILDLHAAPGGQGQDQGISDYNPAKPSLWESKANRDKTVALWKKLAERYKDEPWVGAYDLINEPNWPMSGNVPLRDLYYEITDSIRAVDTSHLIIIEGNWFANDFTGLTPPWDDNMAYGPHKYWSTNNQASIQWVLNLRNTYQVPLYFGEAGENSNQWFRDAIRLFEDNGIGWAWWPMKKVDDIAGPYTVPRPAGYQALLDYWEGNGPTPGAAAAKSTLLQLAEGFKLENAVFQPGVIDAMFRQVYDAEAVPFNTQNIPGVVYATDYDMGVVGSAYSDNDIATYHVSTGNYTAWNNGWAYRNDGVDIEPTEETINTNGYNVGWLGTGEWMQYSVNVGASAVYDIEVRLAASGSTGKFHFTSGTADLTGTISVPSSGGWQNWQTIIVPNIVLTPEDKKLRFYVDADGYNLSSFQFVQKAASSTLATNYLSAFTLDAHTIQFNANKPLSSPLPSSPANFQILVNGSAVPITQANLNTDNSRIITFTVNHTIKSSEVIRISYNGNQIQATDGTLLSTFSQQHVQNTVAIIHSVPGRVQAEDYFFQQGIQLENTSDTGGGQNIGYLDTGDYLDYYINVSDAGTYQVDYRTAAESAMGQVQMQLIDNIGNVTPLHTVTFPPTGGWQTWATTSASLDLPAGQQHIRMLITQPLFNINWFEFTFLTEVEIPEELESINLYPNPGTGRYTLEARVQKPQAIEVRVQNLHGQILWEKTFHQTLELYESLDLRWLPEGHYFLSIGLEKGGRYTSKLVKTGL
ncbi:MAG: carbohydrate-binding protein [Bacteroidia bacterium]